MPHATPPRAFTLSDFDFELPEDLIATTDYGGPMTAFVSRANMAGAQFHPERSADTGARILHNFLTHDFSARAAA